MVILAKNKGKGMSGNNLSYFRWHFGWLIIMYLFLIGMSVYSLINLPPDRNELWYIYLAISLFCAFYGLLYWDDYLRWERARETVSVQYETLVIECSGCIFRRRRKDIPLSTIRKVELYESGRWWLWCTYPERLRVVYSGTHTYRFGICMTPKDREKLAETITELAKCYL